jgi:hypothetical protein
MLRLKKEMESSQTSIFTVRDRIFFKDVPQPQMSKTPFSQGDGFDLYIDGARYLPDNVSISMVTGYVASSDMVMYGRLEKEVSTILGFRV